MEPIVADDLLYHAVHGLCRVEAVNNPRSSAEKLSYTLVPAASDNRMKIRFTVPQKDLPASGFHPPISLKEANKIMEYLKSKRGAASAGSLPAVQGSPAQNDAWGFAQVIQSSSAVDKMGMRDQRRRQLIEHSVKGLVGELSFVMEKTIQEIVADIRKTLGNPAKLNPQIHVALTRVCED